MLTDAIEGGVFHYQVRNVPAWIHMFTHIKYIWPTCSICRQISFEYNPLNTKPVRLLGFSIIFIQIHNLIEFYNL